MAVSSATFGIVYNLFPKVIIKLRGLDSYKKIFFHEYGFPTNKSQNSRGEAWDNNSYVKGLMM